MDDLIQTACSQLKLLQFQLIIFQQSHYISFQMPINQVFHTELPSNHNSGSWNQEQSLKYLIFLDQNKIIMASKLKKKKFRVFDQMSDFVGTRSSLQCRSHHQKALQKYKELKMIIVHQKEQLKQVDYKIKFKELKDLAKINSDYENSQMSHSIQNNRQKNQRQNIVSNPSYQSNISIFGPNFFSQTKNCYRTYNPQIYLYVPFEQQFFLQSYCFYPNFPMN